MNRIPIRKSCRNGNEGDNNDFLTRGVFCLSECYVKMASVDEAMDLYKILCEDIGKERMDPVNILVFAEILQEHRQHSRALTVLEEHLEAIERLLRT